jgi:hypothetical protein
MIVSAGGGGSGHLRDRRPAVSTVFAEHYVPAHFHPSNRVEA